jgi:uncharacterized protein (UPF0332 family)
MDCVLILFGLSVRKHLGVTKLNQFLVLTYVDTFDINKLSPFINEKHFQCK